MVTEEKRLKTPELTLSNQRDQVEIHGEVNTERDTGTVTGI